MLAGNAKAKARLTPHLNRMRFTYFSITSSTPLIKYETGLPSFGGSKADRFHPHRSVRRKRVMAASLAIMATPGPLIGREKQP